MEVKIAKFKLYPDEDPKGYAVGFQVTTNNRRLFYRDTIVPLDDAEGKDDDEIANLAWEQLEDSINNKVEQLNKRRNIINKDWVPRKHRDSDDWDVIDEETLEQREKRIKEKEDELDSRERRLNTLEKGTGPASETENSE